MVRGGFAHGCRQVSLLSARFPRVQDGLAEDGYFLLSVALALNLGLLLGVRLSAAILDSVPAAVALAVVWLVLLLIAAVIQRRETRYRNG